MSYPDWQNITISFFISRKTWRVYKGKCLSTVGTCLTAVHGVAVLFAIIAILLSMCVSRLKNYVEVVNHLLLLLQ